MMITKESLYFFFLHESMHVDLALGGDKIPGEFDRLFSPFQVDPLKPQNFTILMQHIPGTYPKTLTC